jgi:4-diphosphocytidyl-2-C-methyl-D-erythritol kinase
VDDTVTRLVAPAKLTVSLRVLGRRPDGYHELESEMVSIDLHDVVWIDAHGRGMEVVGGPGARAGALESGGENIVARALAAVGRGAGVRLEKRIPVGGGLGGGSADAAAVLRWARVLDPEVAAGLGSDVPFCVIGGRALVCGLGETLLPLPFEPRSFVLLVPPFSVDTAAVYRAWDQLGAAHDHDPGGATGHRRQAGEAAPASQPPAGALGVGNDLTQAALRVEPRLGPWGERLAALTGVEPVLAGSGSTWWVEGTPELLGIGDRRTLRTGRDEGRLIPVRTVPAGWTGPPVAGNGAPADC